MEDLRKVHLCKTLFSVIHIQAAVCIHCLSIRYGLTV